MKPFHRNFLTALLCLSALLSTGCASTARSRSLQHPAVPPAEAQDVQGWWYVRFGILWPENAEPAWNVDMMLADRVVGPVLERHRHHISLWRFHRRAARDGAGHQFSFIFYSSPERARDVMEDIKTSQTLKDMKKQGVIVRESYDPTSAVAKPKMEDTSDAKWSPPVQRAWPYFIMGVSEMWLRLIQQAREQIQGDRPSQPLTDMLNTYRQVNTRVVETWRDEGRHAFLHHLNALFGYEPLVVYERKMMGF